MSVRWQFKDDAVILLDNIVERTNSKVIIGVCAATGIIALSTFIALIAIAANKSSGEVVYDPYTKPKQADVCDSLACHDIGGRIYEMMNTEADPCQDFEEFACGGYRNDSYTIDDITNPKFKQLDEARKFHMKLAEVLNVDDPIADAKRERRNLYNIVRDYYKLCGSWQSQFNTADSTKKSQLLKSLLLEIGHYYNEVFDKPFEKLEFAKFLGKLDLSSLLLSIIRNSTKQVDHKGGYEIKVHLLDNVFNPNTGASFLLKFLRGFPLQDAVDDDQTKTIALAMNSTIDFILNMENDTDIPKSETKCECSTMLNDLKSMQQLKPFNQVSVEKFAAELGMLHNIKTLDKVKVIFTNCGYLQRVIDYVRDNEAAWHFIFFYTQYKQYRALYSPHRHQPSCLYDSAGTFGPILKDMMKRKYFNFNFSAVKSIREKIDEVAMQKISTNGNITETSKERLLSKLTSPKIVIGFIEDVNEMVLKSVQAQHEVQALAMKLSSAEEKEKLLLLPELLHVMRKTMRISQLQAVTSNSMFAKVVHEVVGYINPLIQHQLPYKQFNSDWSVIPMSTMQKFNFYLGLHDYLQYSSMGYLLSYAIAQDYDCGEAEDGSLFKKACDCLSDAYGKYYSQSYEFLSKSDAITMAAGNTGLLGNNMRHMLAAKLTSELIQTFEASKKDFKRLPGFLSRYTPEQLFYIHRIQPFCSKWEKENLKDYYNKRQQKCNANRKIGEACKSSVYPIHYFRSYSNIIAMSAKNSPHFSKMFGCKAGDKMFSEEKNVCKLW